MPKISLHSWLGFKQSKETYCVGVDRAADQCYINLSLQIYGTKNLFVTIGTGLNSNPCGILAKFGPAVAWSAGRDPPIMFIFLPTYYAMLQCSKF